MISDFHVDEANPEDVERWTRNLLKPAPKTAVSQKEERIAARILGSQLAARDMLRQPVASNKKPLPVAIHFEYFDFPGDLYQRGGWTIERYENRIKVMVLSGHDYNRRDSILIRIARSGAKLIPVTIGIRSPHPFELEPQKAKPKRVDRKAVLASIASFTTDDLRK